MPKLKCVNWNCDFPGGSDGKASAYNAGDSGSILGLGRSPGVGNGYPHHWVSQVALTGKGPAYQCRRHKRRDSILGLGGVPGEETATHSRILAWRIPTDRGAWQATIHEVIESDKTE